MKRILVPSLGLLLVALGLWAGWLMKRGPAGAPPQGEDRPPFAIQAAGQGQLIEFQPSEIPIRTLRWSRPLPGGAAVAQVLTQSGRQQALLFVDGHAEATVTLERPADVPENVFHFAELQDAALLPGKLLLLLYRAAPAGGDALLVAWNLPKGAIQWTFRGAGDRLALSPGGRTAFLFGPEAPVRILQLTGKEGLPLPAPAPAKVDLPLGCPGFTDLLATGPADFLATSAEGLSIWTNGAWNRIPPPARSPLGFASSGGSLARTGDTCWWQPEPGQLIQVAADGSQAAPQALAPLIPGAQAQDAALLHLLGADPQGNLWFAPVAPDFAAPQADASIPGIPTPQPAESVPAPLPAGADAQPPVPPAPATPVPSLRETWEPYLKAGLDRLYRWKPGNPAMERLEWATAWPRLSAPAVIPMPSGDGGLVPGSGGFLLGGQEHRWWLPLAAVPLDQPR